MIFLVSILWLSVFGLIHSYVLYPLILKVVASRKSPNSCLYNKDSELPEVSFLMSVYNEEAVIGQKLMSVLYSDYPKDKLNIFVGSDCSDDSTNKIVSDLAEVHPAIHFFPFSERRGKPGVINQLQLAATDLCHTGQNHIFIITDANVMLSKDTVFHLVKHFKNQKIGLVDSNIQSPDNLTYDVNGIAASENSYISKEVYIKNMEGVAWGRTMGPLGGCYALRSNLFEAVPSGFLVDDFYIAMKVFEKGALAVNDLDALCFESSPADISEEFRRKTRISAGNFANLSAFRHLLWHPFSSLAFAFFSHKVLRWYGPFFILISYLCAFILGFVHNIFFYVCFFAMLSFGLFGIPVLDWLLKKINLNLMVLRYITYFNAMNLALFNGFFKYLKGVQNGIWQPTKRDL